MAHTANMHRSSAIATQSCAAPTGVAQEACRPAWRLGSGPHRCPPHQPAAACAPGRFRLSPPRAAAPAEAAEAEQLAAPAPAEAAAESTAAEQAPRSQRKDGKKTGQPKQQRQKKAAGEDSPADAAGKAIIVLEKPVTHSILRRLAEVPQAVLRAGKPDDATTYRAVAAVASAQRQLAASGKVAVYVPYTKASRFTAQLLTADAAILDTPNTVPLTAKATTDAAALGNTLAFALLREGAATVGSAGAAATAKAAEAMRVARALLLKKGFEIGVVPQFAESTGSTGQQITILKQEVISKPLPPPEVVAPSNPFKPLDATAAAAATMLVRQRRCSLRVRQGQLTRLTELLYKVAQPRGKAAGSTESGAASAAAEEGQAAAAAAAAAAAEAGSSQAAGDRKRWDNSSQRLMLVSYVGTDVASPQPASSQPAAAAAHATTAADVAAQPEAAAAAAAATADDAAAAPAAPAAAVVPAAVPNKAFVTLDLQPSRYTTIPVARYGLAGPSGPLSARKAVVSTEASSPAGLVGALQTKLSRLGAAWMYTDGTAAGNKTAWEAFTSLARQHAGSRGSSSGSGSSSGRPSLSALVKVEWDPTVSSSSSSGSDGSQEGDKGAAAGEAAAEAGAGQGQQAQEEGQQPAADAGEPQQEAPAAAAGGGYRLSMLVFYDEEVPRSIMQAPNAPLESSKVGFKQALQLIKFATIANCFLPLSAKSGTGGLVLLPAVLPGPQTAVDYRFAGSGSSGSSSGSSSSSKAQQPVYDYYFRVQRLTEELQGAGVMDADVVQLRVSPSTDPSKLRDAIVAKMLTGQPATLRFTAPAGLLPGFLLSVGVTAVAAARVRLQAKQAGVDVGVMPLVLPDDSRAGQRGDAAAGPGEGRPAFTGSGREGKEGRRVVYSLRLVPLAAAVADVAELPLAL